MESNSHLLIVDLATVLGVAALTTLLFRRLRQPAVLGYLLAGLIVGPHVPVPLVAHLQNIQTLAELGVILLMFSVGLEFDFRKPS
ncbi:MAG: potassium transporter, partial [Holophaga sp.]|nr:potassium transporter [Holophaga sp.]